MNNDHNNYNDNYNHNNEDHNDNYDADDDNSSDGCSNVCDEAMEVDEYLEKEEDEVVQKEVREEEVVAEEKVIEDDEVVEEEVIELIEVDLAQPEKYEDYFDIRRKVKNKLMSVNSIVHLTREKHLEYLYKEIPSDVDITLFQMAMRLNDYEFVCFLINNDVDVTLTTKDYEKPLMTAILLRDRDFVEEILYSGGNPNEYSVIKINGCTYNYSPMELAVKKNEPSIVNLLISKGGCVNNPNRTSNSSLLYLAAEHSCFEAMKALLSSGADVNAVVTVNRGRCVTETALSPIIKRGVNAQAVMTILRNLNIDINFIDSMGYSYLHHAVFLGRNPEIVDQLLDAGIEISVPDSDGHLAVHYEDEDDGSCEACVHIIKRHIIMRIVADFDMCNANMEVIKKTELGDFPHRCYAEVENMKEHHIYGSEVTYYTLLHSSQRQVAKKFEHINVSECLDDQIREKFPIYAGMLIYRLDRARRYSCSFRS